MKSHPLRPTQDINFNQRLTFVSPFKPNQQQLLESLRDKKREIRQNSIETFHNYYNQEIESLDNKTIWLSGSVNSYKLAEIREILKALNSKVVTRHTKAVELLVVGEKTKVEAFPVGLPLVSAISFEKMLSDVKKASENQQNNEVDEDVFIESLLSNIPEKIDEVLNHCESKIFSLTLLSLLFALFKVHKEKEVRQKVKTLLEKQKSKTAKDAMLFCEKRNFLNAKYSVGMEELAKVKGFEIDIFLYYLVLNQKNHLGKEYLASLESRWTQKLLEEHELLNKKELMLYGEAGGSFLHAKKIESLTVHAYSLVLWQMSWLKELRIIDLKKRVVLPKKIDFLSLESLSIETKDLCLAGSLAIKTLRLEKCKKLEIDEAFKLQHIEKISIADCGFEMDVLTDFLKRTSLEKLKTIEISNFVSYKMPKDLKEQIAEILPEVELLVHN